MNRFARTVVGLGLIAVALPGCGAANDQTLTVLAASSLTGPYTKLAQEFEDAHPGVRVRLVFDSSATLAEQVAQHAPGDVLATADEVTMEKAQQAGGTAGASRQFATNVLQLAVPASNPADIHRVTDLASSKVKYLTCVTTAPCGAAATRLLKDAGIQHRATSEEVDVKAVLNKVEQDEADAGLVYRTDVISAGSTVRGIDIPGATKDPNTYWIAITANAGSDELAEAWLALVLNKTGQGILSGAGFGPPQEKPAPEESVQ